MKELLLSSVYGTEGTSPVGVVRTVEGWSGCDEGIKGDTYCDFSLEGCYLIGRLFAAGFFFLQATVHSIVHLFINLPV